ncbi:MAG: hypothetical protein HY067_22725 [Betaproteobacteria bacterium]|nr:hypothetical protein [Betaproteobacteria bacterium]
MKPSLDDVWHRLEELEGKDFVTITGKPFKYEISGEQFFPSRTKYTISKTEFGKAVKLVPFDGPGVISKSVRGPSYVWAVLHDQRVRKSDW